MESLATILYLYPKVFRASATTKLLPPMNMKSLDAAQSLAARTASATVGYEYPIKPFFWACIYSSRSFMARGTEALVK